MLLAAASAAAGVGLLVAPYVNPVVAVALATLAAAPLVVLWRTLAAEDAEFPQLDPRLPRGLSDRSRPAPSRAR
jgi:hypothetical protein